MMCVNTLNCITYAKGSDAPLPAAGLTTMEFLGEIMAVHFLVPGAGQSMVEDDRNKAVARLTMDMLKTPGKVPEPLMGAYGCMPASVRAWQNLLLIGVAVVCLDTQWGRYAPFVTRLWGDQLWRSSCTGLGWLIFLWRS